MADVRVGDKIVILTEAGENCHGKIGYVRKIDDIFQAYGTWGKEPICLYLDTVFVLNRTNKIA